jgi:hypothetical protein
VVVIVKFKKQIYQKAPTEDFKKDAIQKVLVGK